MPTYKKKSIKYFLLYYRKMNNEEIIKELNIENSILKDKILQMQNELFEVKHKLNTYQTNLKKYYEINKEKIIERVKNYNKEKKERI